MSEQQEDFKEETIENNEDSYLDSLLTDKTIDTEKGVIDNTEGTNNDKNDKKLIDEGKEDTEDKEKDSNEDKENNGDEDEEKLTDEEKDFISKLDTYKTLTSDVGLELEEDDLVSLASGDKKISDFVEKNINEKADENFNSKLKESGLSDLYKYLKNGGNIESYVKNSESANKYLTETFDKTNVAQAEKTIKEWLELKGFSDEDINEEISDYKKSGLIAEKGEKVYNKLKNYYKDINKREVEALEKEKEIINNNINNFNNSIENIFNEVIVSIKDEKFTKSDNIRLSNLIKIDKETGSAPVFNKLQSVFSDSLSDDENLSKKAIANLKKLAYFVDKDFNIFENVIDDNLFNKELHRKALSHYRNMIDSKSSKKKNKSSSNGNIDYSLLE